MGSSFGGIDHQSAECREMLGTGFYIRRLLPFARAEIGSCQEFAEGKDAGERGAHLVREDWQYADRAFCRARPAAHPPPHWPAFLFGPRSRRLYPRHAT